MITQRYRLTTLFYQAGDLSATLLAFFAAWYLRFETDLLPFTKDHLPEFRYYLQLLPIVLVVWAVVFHFHGLYQTRRGRSSVDEALTILIAVVLAAVLLMGISTLIRIEVPRPDGLGKEVFPLSRGFLAAFVGLNVVFLVVFRRILRGYLQHIRRHGRNQQRILIVGAGELGQEVLAKFQEHRELGFDVVGFLDDEPAKQGRLYSGVPVIGTTAEAEEILVAQAVDQIYLALPVEAHQKTMEVLRQVGSECVEVKMVPDILQYATLKAVFEDLDGTPVINLTQVPLRGWSSLVKRSMDLGIATVALAGLLPFLPFVALAIWLEDRGPIFYRQERMGLDGSSFWILKFRSMRVDAEATTGPVWAIRDDPRRTMIGSLLRRWSLDELPQLFNVIRGDMSIVGPRPERPAFVREFKGQLPQYMLRHRVKAGITGWAQVHGWRGNTSIRKRLQYDLYYIENWSLGLDIKILWMTLRHGWWHNAY